MLNTDGRNVHQKSRQHVGSIQLATTVVMTAEAAMVAVVAGAVVGNSSSRAEAEGTVAMTEAEGAVAASAEVTVATAEVQ